MPASPGSPSGIGGRRPAAERFSRKDGGAVQPELVTCGRVPSADIPGERHMLELALFFLVVAVIAAVFGFTGIAAAAAGIAKMIFYIFVVLFVVFLIVALLLGRAIF
jgi:uncharacterized membrane protein YtjA (UPF0391 family)